MAFGDNLNVENPAGGGPNGDLAFTQEFIDSFMSAFGLTGVPVFVASAYVDWPLLNPIDTGYADARGRLYSETYDPNAKMFWKKATIEPPLWIPLSGGGTEPPATVWDDGTVAQWNDGTGLEMSDT